MSGLSDKIKIEDIKAYHGGKLCFESESLELPVNTLITVVGPNGAGKTTFLESLLGLNPEAQLRSFSYCEKDLMSLSKPEFAKMISWCPVGMTTPFDFSFKEIVEFGFHPFQLAKEEDGETAALSIMEQVGCLDLADKIYNQLSSGQAKLGAICQALVKKSPITLFDEPTAHLDKSRAIEVMQLFKKISIGSTIIIVTHDLDIAYRFSDYCVIIDCGRVKQIGPSKSVLTPQNIENTFKVKCDILTSPSGTSHLVYQ